MKKIKDEFDSLNLLFDRTSYEDIELPYLYEDIKIKGNTYVTSSVLNSSLYKLFYNFMFLYKFCNLSNFKILNTKVFSLSAY